VTSVAPPAPTRPRPVFCALGHAHHDLEVAEAVCAGRFTHAGITVELGLAPDWLGAELPADDEWRIEWTKFYYGLDLAHAFATTGEPRFLRAWELLVSSWIERVPIGLDSPDVAARRVQNWIYAWDRFATAPGFGGLAEGLAASLLHSLRDQALHIRDNLTPGPQRNHRTLELYALLVAALAFPDRLDPDRALLELALAELNRCLVEGTREDGVHRESSTHYHLLALRSFVGARENARRFGLELPRGYDDRLGRACEFAIHCHRPDGPISALSDADGGRYAELLELAGSLLDRPDLRWVASRGASGEPPRRRGASFPEGGYFTQRSGWGEGATAFADERYLIFDCGPLGDGGHGHYDLLSVEIAAGGRPLLVDPGRFTYAEGPPNLRRWFKGTAAHNTVCVDGLDQTPYRRGRPRGAVAEGRFLGRLTAPGLDVLRGEARSPRYEAVHRRTILFVASEYWLIEDRLRGERPHRYDLRFHLSSEANGATAVEAENGASAVRAPGLALVLDPALEVHLEPGWVAPLYGVRLEAPVVSASLSGEAEACFVTLVVPRRRGEASPGLRVGPGGAAGATVVEVRGVGPGGEAVDAVTWDERSRVEWRRRSAGGEILARTVCGADRSGGAGAISEALAR
jgi:hypothetical protein